MDLAAAWAASRSGVSSAEQRSTCCNKSPFTHRHAEPPSHSLPKRITHEKVQGHGAADTAYFVALMYLGAYWLLTKWFSELSSMLGQPHERDAAKGHSNKQCGTKVLLA